MMKFHRIIKKLYKINNNQIKIKKYYNYNNKKIIKILLKKTSNNNSIFNKNFSKIKDKL
jgi:hypothetical protein